MVTQTCHVQTFTSTKEKATQYKQQNIGKKDTTKKSSRPQLSTAAKLALNAPPKLIWQKSIENNPKAIFDQSADSKYFFDFVTEMVVKRKDLYDPDDYDDY